MSTRAEARPQILRANSSVVDMIVGVERLYEYGVSIGILPEDRDMSLSLTRMKHRFLSLLLPVSTEVETPLASRSHNDDSSDNS